MLNAGLDEALAGIKISGRNINNGKYADDIILIAKSKKELKTLLMKVKKKGEWNSWLKTQHSKNKDHGIWSHQFSSVQSLSRVQLFATPWIAACQASLSIINSRSLLKLMTIKSVMPSSHLILCHPLLLLPPIPRQHQVLFQWVNSSHQVAKVLDFQLQHQSFQWTPRTYLLQDGLVGSPCSPRDSQESSPTPQFKSINFSVLSFLHSPTFISIHDHWTNHSLDQMDLCWQSNVSAF